MLKSFGITLIGKLPLQSDTEIAIVYRTKALQTPCHLYRYNILGRSSPLKKTFNGIACVEFSISRMLFYCLAKNKVYVL